jgi:RNA polymerase sigma factor (sigma-70 family)
MDDTDGELLKATARGDAEAFGRFYRRHERRVLAYAVGRCTNASDVADLVAETFLAALGSASRFRDEGGDAIPWLYGIARRVLARQRRSYVRRQRLNRQLQNLPSLVPEETLAVEAALDAARLGPPLTTALAALRPKDRELLELVSRDGLAPTQAGAVLGMNPNTARLRLSRARARLRSTLGQSPRQPRLDAPEETPHVQP